MISSLTFRPFRGLIGGHRQTLAGHLTRSRLTWSAPTEDAVVDAPDQVRILLRASWQSGARREHPTLLLIHGLEGCDRSAYMLSTGEWAYRNGWHVVRMNMRGCGDALEICPRLYNAGATTDLLAVLEWLASEVNHISICGFSLGANLALLTSARHRESVPQSVRAIAAVCPPLDLSVAADALSHAHNRLYQLYFMNKLKSSYIRRQKLLRDVYAPDQAQGCRTVREYDDAVVAPYSGFENAEDYYRQSSSGPHLTSLERPTLILSSADDPMIPVQSVVRWAVPTCVNREITPTGGHVGFVGQTRAPGRFWAAEKVMHFFDQNRFQIRRTKD